MDTKREGRRRYSEQERRELIEQQERSGLSQAAFCRRVKIHPVTFSIWRRAAKRPVAAFAEVQISAPAATHTTPVVNAAAVLHLRDGAKLELALAGDTAWSGLGLMLKTLQA